MKLDYFLKKEKINKILSYTELKDGSKIFFGWTETKKLDLNNKLILSKKIDSEANQKIIEVATTNDYRLFFKASTSSSPEDFLDKWTEKQSDLQKFLKSKKENTLKDESVFWIKMADLIVNGKNFNKYGISYKFLDLE